MKDTNNKMVNILHICSWYPNRTSPFDGNFIEKHIKLTTPFSNAYVLSVYEDANLKKPAFEFEKLRENGIVKYVYYHKTQKAKLFKLIFRFYLYFKGFNKIRKEAGHIDLIHAHVMLFGGVFSWLITRIFNIPYIVTEHSTIYHQEKLGWFTRIFARIAGDRSKYLLPVSKDLQQKMLAHGIKGNYKVIPNVVDTLLFNPENVKKENNSNYNFLHISNFSYNKNIPGLLSAVKKLSRKRKDFKLIIAGDGDINQVKLMIEKLELINDLVDVEGPLTEVQVAMLMQEADNFVLFSRSENLPCVLLEAQASGLPVISSNVGGIGEIISSEQYGILIQNENIEELVEAMDFMIDNADQYDSNKIRHNAENHYSIEAVRRSLINVYADVLGTNI